MRDESPFVWWYMMLTFSLEQKEMQSLLSLLYFPLYLPHFIYSVWTALQNPRQLILMLLVFQAILQASFVHIYNINFFFYR